ncbi:MAG: modification methylase [Mycoplasmataceae bacterium RV_VA103A]|nr:MAG: modification methylase [Mycoplasmataceae bacterium RV_VA103A]
MNGKEYLKNVKQEGEALEFLQSLPDKSVALAFFDPQYEKVGDVSRVKDWPLHYQSENQITEIIKQIERVLKPSGFCLLWISKEILKLDRVQSWLLRTTRLKMVDFLVWNKNKIGMGSYFRSSGEYAWLLQKNPQTSRKFTDKSFPNVWKEESLSTQRRKHPHQKPFYLIRTLINATTQAGDLIVDPCAGSFIVLDACQDLGRDFIGVDLTLGDLKEHNENLQAERERERERAEMEPLNSPTLTDKN